MDTTIEEPEPQQPSTSAYQAPPRETELLTGGEFELYVLIERFLTHGPFARVGAFLRKELNSNAVTPKRYDFQGGQHERSYREYVNELQSRINIPDLFSLVDRLAELNNEAIPPSVAGLPPGLLAPPRNAIDHSIHEHFPSLAILGSGMIINSDPNTSFRRILAAREMGGRALPRQICGQNRVVGVERHYRVTGHIAPIYCVLIDRTANYILTGADDMLVKVWDLRQGTLRFTLRGHSGQISDMSISTCNTLLITASVDKTIRAWSLETGACLKIWKPHTAQISSIKWLPFGESPIKWFITTSWDCSINFYRYDSDKKEFYDGFESFCERDNPGLRLCTSTHSPGGRFVAVGDSHSRVRLFSVDEHGPKKLDELEGHTDRVDSLVWAHSGMRIASGSPDGTARVWMVKDGKWRHITLKLDKSEQANAPITLPVEAPARNKSKYKITMLCWSYDDRWIVTAGNDCVFRVWDPTTAKLIHKMAGQGVSYVLVPHPLHHNLLFTAGHDGTLMLWDLTTGKLRNRWENAIENGVSPPLFDLALSDDGTHLAVVDGEGQLSLYGMGQNRTLFKRPRMQFFTSDYAVLAADDDGNVVDDDTGLPPHLLPPPQLSDGSDNIYEERIQRLIVPGRNDPSVRDEDLKCYWATNKVIPPLREELMNRDSMRIQEMGDEEMDIYQLEISKECEEEESEAPPPTAPTTRSQEPGAGRRNFADRLAESFRFHEARLREAQAARRARHRRRHGEEVDATDEDTRDVPIRSDNEGGERSDDDERSASEEEEDDDGDSGSSTSDTDFSMGERSARRQRLVDAETNDDPNEPGPSSPVRGQTRRQEDMLRRQNEERRRRQDEERTRRVQAAARPARERTTRRARTNDRSQPSNSGNNTTPLRDWAANFPEWSRKTVPRRFPYIAQPGDNVVYFRQGHSAYLNGVQQSRTYDVTPRMYPRNDLEPEEFCRVTDVRYTSTPYRLIVVELTRCNRDTYALTDFSWTIKYHDLHHVADFIVLRHIYDASIQHRYDSGDLIEAELEGKWYVGEVSVREPMQPEFPRSSWNCLKVKWTSGEDDQLSPWDVQPLSENRRSETALSEDEFAALAVCPLRPGDWPSRGRIAEPMSSRQASAVQRQLGHERDLTVRKIREGIAYLEAEPDWRIFYDPVPIDEHPDYPRIVDYPSDLKTIAMRLENNYYRRLEAMHLDACYIYISADKFNDPGSTLVYSSLILAMALIKFSSDPHGAELPDVIEATRNMEKTELIAQFQAHMPKRKPANRAAANADAARAQPSTSTALAQPSGWVLETQRVLADLMRENVANHFVDRNNPTQAMRDIWPYCAQETMCLKQILEWTKTASSPHEVVDRVTTLVDTVNSVVDEPREQSYRDGLGLKQKLAQRMRRIIERFEESVNSVAKSLRVATGRVHELRQRHRPSTSTTNHRYGTRQHDADRDQNRRSTSSFNTSATRRGSRDQGVYIAPGPSADLNEDEVLPPRTRRRRVIESPESEAHDALSSLGSARSSSVFSGHEPTTSRSQRGRRNPRERQLRELMNEQQDLMDDLEAQMSDVTDSEDGHGGRGRRRRSSRTAKPPSEEMVQTSGRPSRRFPARASGSQQSRAEKRGVHDDSEEDTAVAPPAQNGRVVTRKKKRQRGFYEEDSDDDAEANAQPEPSISSRGRTRKLRKL
ncbi:unnamed protein product, partial [Mesorhabditis spiculigera]